MAQTAILTSHLGMHYTIVDQIRGWFFAVEIHRLGFRMEMLVFCTEYYVFRNIDISY